MLILVGEQNGNWIHSKLNYFDEQVIVDILDLATCRGLNLYFTAKLGTLCNQGEALWRRLLLLLCQIQFFHSWPDHHMNVAELLRLGADTNHEVPCDGRTIWEIHLHDVSMASKPPPKSTILIVNSYTARPSEVGPKNSCQQKLKEKSAT